MSITALFDDVVRMRSVEYRGLATAKPRIIINRRQAVAWLALFVATCLALYVFLELVSGLAGAFVFNGLAVTCQSIAPPPQVDSCPAYAADMLHWLSWPAQISAVLFISAAFLLFAECFYMRFGVWSNWETRVVSFTECREYPATYGMSETLNDMNKLVTGLLALASLFALVPAAVFGGYVVQEIVESLIAAFPLPVGYIGSVLDWLFGSMQNQIGLEEMQRDPRYIGTCPSAYYVAADGSQVCIYK